MLSMSSQFIVTAPLVKWITKEKGLYVNRPTVILTFKCSNAKDYCNGLIDGPVVANSGGRMKIKSHPSA
jgi:hypothetical protein